ncbi:MAG TPA: hypothetical protein VGO62_15790 [Myxococcota bacterium]
MTPALALVAGLALAAPAPAPAPTASIGAVERVEKYASVSVRSVVVDALARTIDVTGDEPFAIARAVQKSAACPQRAFIKGGVRLTCVTRLLDAAVVHGHLELRQLRVVPAGTRESLPPTFSYVDDPALGLSAVPEAVAAEAAFLAGDDKNAQLHLEAVRAIQPGYAAVRSGDIAILRGDYDGALSAWDRGGSGGPFSRLAAVRLCEIDPTCIADPVRAVGYDPFDATAMSQLTADEIALRRVRALAFHDDIGAAVTQLVAWRAAPCARDPGLCRVIDLEAFKEAGAQPDADALTLYGLLPDRLSGASGYALARIAAEQAAQQGAPLFAAHVLSASSVSAPVSELEQHLVRTAELYLAADDPARAGAVVAYARSRYPKAARLKKLEATVAQAMARPVH